MSEYVKYLDIASPWELLKLGSAQNPPVTVVVENTWYVHSQELKSLSFADKTQTVGPGGGFVQGGVHGPWKVSFTQSQHLERGWGDYRLRH